MARGDVISNIANVPAGADLNFQPPVGVEVLITEVGSSIWGGANPNRTPDVFVKLSNGTIECRMRMEGEAVYWGGGILKLFITNAIFLRVENRGTVAGNIAYCGIQTK